MYTLYRKSNNLENKKQQLENNPLPRRQNLLARRSECNKDLAEKNNRSGNAGPNSHCG